MPIKLPFAPNLSYENLMSRLNWWISHLLPGNRCDGALVMTFGQSKFLKSSLPTRRWTTYSFFLWELAPICTLFILIKCKKRIRCVETIYSKWIEATHTSNVSAKQQPHPTIINSMNFNPYSCRCTLFICKRTVIDIFLLSFCQK